MKVLRTGLVVALAAGLSGAPVLAQDSGGGVPAAHFQLRTSARVLTHAIGQGPVRLVAFAGGGKAEATRRNIRLSAGQLSQRNGDGTLDLAPSGPLKRLRHSRVYLGRGTASATIGDEQIGFDHVRVAAHIRGRGDRVRLLGKFYGRDGGGADVQAAGPRSVLYGRFRGQLVHPDPAT